MDSLAADVVYVSGRKRPPGEMNGKSGNINNVCSQLYPPGTVVPGNELICIFDADQVMTMSAPQTYYSPLSPSTMRSPIVLLGNRLLPCLAPQPHAEYPAAQGGSCSAWCEPTNTVCLQVCSKDFFLKTVPLFDGGDDVGMVLSPQCFHNLNLHTDIFNHSNVHFWEYMQPGYDALGFISCTGTNFLVSAPSPVALFACAC